MLNQLIISSTQMDRVAIARSNKGSNKEFSLYLGQLPQIDFYSIYILISNLFVEMIDNLFDQLFEI